MIKWTPRIPKPPNLDKSQFHKHYLRRILSLFGVIIFGGMLALYLPKNSVMAYVTIIATLLLSLGLYMSWRNSLFSYWYSNGADKFYYEDYSWKDSLTIGLILLCGLILVGLALVYVASRINFSNVQSLSVWLGRFI